MKKTLKSVLALAFCLLIAVATMSFSLAAPGKFTLKATATPTSITLKWSVSDGAESYIVQRYYGGKWKAITTTTKRSYTAKNLSPNGTYTYRICAVDEDSSRNNKTYTSQLAVKTVLAKVGRLKAEQYGYNTVKLSWNKVTGAGGYQIQQYDTKSKKWVTAKNVSSKYNYAAIKSLKNGSSYKFRVRAYLKVSGKYYYGSVSSSVSVKVAVPKPATVKTTTSYNAIKLTWSKVPNATGYRIYKYDSAKKKWVTAVKSTTKTSYTFKNLDTGTTYSYRVRAYQTVSKKVYWGSYDTIKAKPALKKVSGITESATTMSAVKFQWNKVSGASGYYVYRYVDGKWKNLGKTTKLSFTEKNLLPGTKYTYRVRAYRTVNGKNVNGSVSSSFNIQTDALKSVGDVTVGTCTTNSIALSWADIGAAGYEIYDASSNNKLLDTANTSAVVSSLQSGTAYSFKVIAYYEINGEKLYSNPGVATAQTKGEAPTDPTKPTEPSTQPTTKPTTQPTTKPTTQPTTKPTTQPTTKPTTQPTTKPTTQPTTKPTTQPTTKPTTQPTTKPTTQPTTKPTTQPTTQPATPAKVTGLTAVSSTETTITIRWNKSTNATNYKVSYAEKGSSQWKDANTTFNSYTIANLKENTQYVIKVTAANSYVLGVASDELTASTKQRLPEAEKILTAKSLDSEHVQLSWNAIGGAATYDLQYYQYTSGWVAVPGANNLTARTFTEELKPYNGYLYRVVARNAVGDEISVSEPVVGTAKGLTVTQDNYKVTISWDKQSGVKNYSLLAYLKNLGSTPVDGISDFTNNSVTVYLAPGNIHSFNLIVNYTDGSAKTLFTGLSVMMPEMDLTDKSDEAVNGQLLYLAQAVNSSKYDYSDVTLKYDSVTNYEIDYLKSTSLLVGVGEYNGVKEVQKFFDDKFNDGTSDPMLAVDTDKLSENISFTYGRGKNAKERDVELKYMIEPVTNRSNYYLATIYGAQKPSNWKNGFSNVTTTRTADGGYEITAVIKKETLKDGSNSLYHQGLFESVGAAISDAGSGSEITNATVGATTIKAKINVNGTLDSYVFESSFDATFSMSEPLMLGSITMNLKGTIEANYKFTR